MAANEAARLHLYERARHAMDDEAARTLMSALPWEVTELATKQDLAVVRHELIAAIASARLAIVTSLIAVNAATLGSAIALLQLIR